MSTPKSNMTMLLVPVVLVVGFALMLMWLATPMVPVADQPGSVPTAATDKRVTGEITAQGMAMLLLPGGRFVMGRASDDQPGGADELPAHAVNVAPFYIGKYEVTQAQWVAVMDFNPSRYKDPRRPVDQVTWLQAQEFIQKLNKLEKTTKYRLPTEAEWEYAARAGTTSTYFFGDNPRDLSRYAWFGAENDVGTAPVGKKQPNPWGLHDIYGNVWEWVEDCAHPDYQGAPTDARPRPGGDCALRVVRGGGWNSPADYARSAVRGNSVPDLNDSGTGFRLARWP